MKRLLSLALGFLLFGWNVHAEGASPQFKKVMIVVLENTDYDEALKQPFLSGLVKKGALLDDFHAETHPSQPNYIAMISGSTQNVLTDGAVNLSATHVGDLLEAKGLQWKVYAENFPGNCFLGARSGTYVRKHVPFLSFLNVQSDPARCGRIVEASQLARDIQGAVLPDFSLYVPNLNNDGHDTGAAAADQWLAKAFGPLLQNPTFSQDMLLVVTFDESENHFGTNQVFTVLIGDSVTPGSRSSLTYDHYSLLRTVEDRLGLGTLGRNDAQARAIQGVWK